MADIVYLPSICVCSI